MADRAASTFQPKKPKKRGHIWPQRPTLAEPPQTSVLAAMVAFPEIVANGSYAVGGIGPWSYALPTSQKGRYGTLRIMANYLCDEGHTPTAAAWAVYWLAKHGLIVETGETVADGESWCVTTPVLLDWWKAGCPGRTLNKVGEWITKLSSPRRRNRGKGAAGRPPIEGAKEELDLKLRDDWQRAKDAGITMKDFCNDPDNRKRGITEREVNRVVDLFYRRRKRSQS